MAKAKKAAPAKQEIERIELGNGNVLVRYDDGTWAIITVIPASVVETLTSNSSDEDDEDDEDEDDDEVTPEVLAGADFEELEDICDDKNLDTDPDDFDEDEVEKLRAAVAKELGIKLPKKATKKGKK